MRKTILIFLFIFMASNNASASEITGRISTNMKPVINNGGGNNGPTGDKKNDSDGGSGGDDGKEAESGGGQASAPVAIKNQAGAASSAVKEKRENNLEEANYAKEKILGGVKVLGAYDADFDDGELVRGPDMKIYVIEKGMKMYIPGLKELAKYAGRRILDVDEEALSEYKDIEKKYGDGDLIRGYGEEKVYAIKNGAKRHIASYEELKKNHFGLEIFNVSPAELSKY